MKKSTWTLILFIILGLLAGAILTQLLQPVEGLSFLTRTTEISWHPKANLQMISYDLRFEVKLNVISFVTLITAIWIHRKL